MFEEGQGEIKCLTHYKSTDWAVVYKTGKGEGERKGRREGTDFFVIFFPVKCSGLHVLTLWQFLQDGVENGLLQEGHFTKRSVVNL